MIRNIVSALAFVLFAASPALAQSYGVESKINGVHVRSGVSCLLHVNGVVDFRGTCTVGRKGDATVINAAGLEFGIVRDDDTDYQGTIYLIDGSDLTRIERVSANGNCWIGSSTKFCAL